MIVVDSLSHIYPATRRRPMREALKAVSFTVPRGALCVLSGPNGGGKSTLFRILCGLSAPSAGAASIDGHDLATAAPAAREALGVVFQSPALDKHLSVLENLKLHGELYGVRGAAFAERLDQCLGWTDIAGRLGEKVETLSGGLARQAELAKALVTRPRVLLLDEPTTGLDPVSRRAFIDTLRRVRTERGATILMTSHVFSDAERADVVAILSAGELMAFDSPDVLKSRVGTDMVVIRPRDAGAFEAVLETGFLATRDGLSAYRHRDELRIGNITSRAAMSLIRDIVERHRDDILSIGVKRPDLEDVFVHITGKGAAAKPGGASIGAPP